MLFGVLLTQIARAVLVQLYAWLFILRTSEEKVGSNVKTALCNNWRDPSHAGISYCNLLTFNSYRAERPGPYL